MIQNWSGEAAGKFIQWQPNPGKEGRFEPIMLNCPEKNWKFGLRILSLLGLVLALAGCISSTSPILSDPQPALGERGVIHTFSLRAGAAHEPGQIMFRWSGSRYVVTGGSIGFSDFSAHPYQGRDFIVQGTTQRAPHRIEYGLARKLADGVYLLLPIDEDDADAPTREKFCTKTQDAACRIATPEQLFVFARASADKTPEGGGLAVVVPRSDAAKHQ
jgi:hypothetical protein